MGGVSSEKEVSLASGQRVLEALRQLGYAAGIVVYEGDIAATVKALQGRDLVFIALHGGEGEDGTVQAALDDAGLRYSGSSSGASRLAMDKHHSKERMLAAALPTPAWVRLQLAEGPIRPGGPHEEALANFLDQRSYPLVVKPNGQGSTVGLSVVEQYDQLPDALSLAREFDSQVLVEAYIPGRELTVTVLDQRPLPVVEIVPRHPTFDYECKYTEGMSTYTVPAELPLELTVAVQEAAQRLYEDLGCRHYARIDLRLDPEYRFYCLELNTLPGLTAHSLTPMAAEAAGIPFPALIDRITGLALADPVPA